MAAYCCAGRGTNSCLVSHGQLHTNGKTKSAMRHVIGPQYGSDV